MRRVLPPDPRWPKPKTVGEAREQIERVFEENGWDERDRRVFAEMVGVPAKPVAAYSAGELRAIRERMLVSRMILEQ